MELSPALAAASWSFIFPFSLMQHQLRLLFFVSFCGRIPALTFPRGSFVTSVMLPRFLSILSQWGRCHSVLTESNPKRRERVSCSGCIGGESRSHLLSGYKYPPRSPPNGDTLRSLQFFVLDQRLARLSESAWVVTKCRGLGGFNNRHCLLTVLEAKRFKVQVLGRAHSLARGRPPFCCVLTWPFLFVCKWRERRPLCLPLRIRPLIPSQRSHSDDLIETQSPPDGPAPQYHHFGGEGFNI